MAEWPGRYIDLQSRDPKFKSTYKFRRVRKECPPPNTVVVSCNQKLCNFALCYSQVIAMDPRKFKDFMSLVFSKVAENTRAIPVQIPSHRWPITMPVFSHSYDSGVNCKL